MSDAIVKVDGVSKKYCRFIKHTMLYGTADLARSFFGFNQHTERLRNGEFWAVDDLNFELRRGETLGLIGPNGSGKSTILKLINGIFLPDKGKIEIKGRVGALIDVGAGFHPMLTGRENIYINGAILGMRKKEIDKKFDQIVDFAEISDFIDAPIKHYSSGMVVRLGFAVAVHTEPDIMLIDEVLAVGDIGFRAKCFNAISKISQNAVVLFVSHSMHQITRVCTDICVINKGKAVYMGKDITRGLDNYFSQFAALQSVVTGSGRAAIHQIELAINGEKNVGQISYMDDLYIHLNITVDHEVRNPVVNISFLSQELEVISQCNSLLNRIEIQNTGKPLHITVKFPKVNLNPGIYFLSVEVTDETCLDVLTKHHTARELKVKGKFIGRASVQLVGEWDIEQA